MMLDRTGKSWYNIPNRILSLNRTGTITMKFPYESLHRFPLGSLRANGFFYEQMRRCKEGFGGHLDELEPGMIADPFVNKSYVPM